MMFERRECTLDANKMLYELLINFREESIKAIGTVIRVKRVLNDKKRND